MQSTTKIAVATKQTHQDAKEEFILPSYALITDVARTNRLPKICLVGNLAAQKKFIPDESKSRQNSYDFGAVIIIGGQQYSLYYSTKGLKEEEQFYRDAAIFLYFPPAPEELEVFRKVIKDQCNCSTAAEFTIKNGSVISVNGEILMQTELCRATNAEEAETAGVKILEDLYSKYLAMMQEEQKAQSIAVTGGVVKQNKCSIS